MSGQAFPLARRALAWVTRHRVRLIDVALFVDAFLMIVTEQTVLWFHIVFVLLSIKAFYVTFRPFLLRAVRRASR